MMEQTEALALRIFPHSRTSQVATWLTPGHGRIVTLVKGAMRPKSPFLGQYDLFYTCELVYYARGNHGVRVARECCPISLRPAFRTDWRAMCCASYVCDLASYVALEGQPHEELYRLVTMALDALARRPTPAALFWHDLQLLSILGFGLQLDRCAICTASVTQRKLDTFSAASGGLVCDSCSPRAKGVMRNVPPDVLRMLRRWQASPEPHQASAEPCTSSQAALLDPMLGSCLNYHLDTLVRSRHIAMHVLRTWGAQQIDRTTT